MTQVDIVARDVGNRPHVIVIDKGRPRRTTKKRHAAIAEGETRLSQRLSLTSCRLGKDVGVADIHAGRGP